MRLNLLFLICFLAIPAATAQSSAGGGTIQGVVRDSSGAVVPSANLSIANTETGVVSSSLTNKDGYFSTPALNIGKYLVKVSAPGMKSWEAELALETGKIAEISPVLSPGQVTETVTVTSSVPLVTTTDPTQGSTLDANRIEELPVNGRSLLTLIEDVTPGVEGSRVSGLMNYAIDFVQDGAGANNRENGGALGLQGLDSIGEVRVETSTSSARYNRPASVIVTTKSGTNQLHGALYETVRNNAFGVARARQDVNLNGEPYSTPKLIRNEFGGSMGGPVVLPSFGWNGKRLYNRRNRTFWFYSREGSEQRQGSTRDYAVPTVAMRSGNFNGLSDSLGRAITLYDPLTTSTQTAANGRVFANRLPFNGNVIPVNRISPLAKRIYEITPLPSDFTNPLVTTNLKIPVPASNTSTAPTTIRLDHRLSNKDSVWAKTNFGNAMSVGIASGATTGVPTKNYEANVTFQPQEVIAGSISWTHIFSASLFAETLVSRNWQSILIVTGAEDKDWSKELGLPNPFNEIGWPNITSNGFTGYIEGDNRRFLRSIVTNAEQNYTLIKRTHNFGFGWRWHVEKLTLQPDQGAISGSATFNSLATSLMSTSTGSTTAPAATPQTGFDGANFFLGYAATYSAGLKRGLMHITDTNSALYFQDNYKVTERLTITPGLRWDINPAMSEANYLLNSFDLKSHSILLPQSLDYYYKLGVTSPKIIGLYDNIGVKFSTAADLNRSPNLFQPNYFDFGPRAGFAYRLTSGARQMVVRGGYGMYLSAIPMRTLLAQFSSMAPFRASFSSSPNTAAQSPDGISNYLLRAVPPVTAGVNSANVIDINSPSAVGRGITVKALGDTPSMRIHEWNLALEKQFNTSTVLRLSYSGKHGVNADQLQEINPTQTDYVWYTTTGQALPTGTFASVARRPYDQNAYASVQILQKTGFINTSVFAAEVQRRFTKGLGFQVFYSMTNALRAAGNSFRDGIGGTPDGYLPGAVPKDPVELNRFLNYSRDTGIPKHRVRWNWNYDLPFGRGRQFAKTAPKAVDALIGGWKMSGTGTMLSTWLTLPTDNWGTVSNFEVYGKKYPILDCRSTPALSTNPKDERCIEGYLWFNGYISERNINSRNAAGLRNGVFGLPSNYHPAQKPVTPWPKDGQPGAAGASDWDTDFVYVKLNNGVVQRVDADTGLHPWRNQSRLGPFNWVTDASLLKYFSVTERLRLRANVDVFNVFNNQGLNIPASNGIVSLANSYNTGTSFRPRQVQVTMRLEW